MVAKCGKDGRRERGEVRERNSSLFALAHCPAAISVQQTPGTMDTRAQRVQWTGNLC